VAVSIPDCVKQILFANRQWFDDRFGYVWKDPASVKLDSAIRLWAGVPYVLPAELVSAQPAQAEPAPQRSPTPPIHLAISIRRASRRRSIDGGAAAIEQGPAVRRQATAEQQKGLIAPMKT
jgi:hypothetical protein